MNGEPALRNGGEGPDDVVASKHGSGSGSRELVVLKASEFLVLDLILLDSCTQTR